MHDKSRGNLSAACIGTIRGDVYVCVFGVFGRDTDLRGLVVPTYLCDIEKA